MKIAIIGHTSHVAQGLYFYLQNKYEMFLYSRENINFFEKNDYDIIINCVGFGSSFRETTNWNELFELTEKYDNKIISKIEKYPDSLYINFSSGSVYNKLLTESDQYSLIKMYFESKHRSLIHLNIVDIRLFNYFSRFVDLRGNYLINHMINSIKNNTTFITNSIDIIRDYIHPSDLAAFILCCYTKKLNSSLDVYSKAPISKFELINYFVSKYNLKYEIKEDLQLSSITGIKLNYQAQNKIAETLNYFPKLSSLQTIEEETSYLLN